MSGVILALCCAISWGGGDFLGGMMTKRLPALTVVLWSQIAGGAAVLLVALFLGGRPTMPEFLWGGAAGLAGAVGLALFYRGLAGGVMSVVAPISACSAVVPVAVTLLGGSVPPRLALVGAGVALAGVMLASLAPSPARRVVATHWWARLRQTGILYALGAALGFGGFLLWSARGVATPGASPWWVIAAARLTSPILLSLLIRLTRAPLRVPWRLIPGVAGTGTLDTGANVLFAFATTAGNLALVSVVAALYPVTTVLLAFLLLRERLTSTQALGVALALVGVVLIAAG